MIRTVGLILLASLILFAGLAHAGPLNTTHATSFVVYPKQTNHMGTLFGGRVVSEMDRTAGIAVRRLLYASTARSAVTVAISEVSFKAPGKVGDLVFVTADVVALSRKTITLKVRAERENADGTRTLLADAVFIFAAMADGKSAEHGLKLSTEGK